LQITQRRTEANTLNFYRQTKAKMFFFSKIMNNIARKKCVTHFFDLILLKQFVNKDNKVNSNLTQAN
jgi:hypothetical protein